MLESLALLAFITLQRAGEMIWAKSNERRLCAKGAAEVGAAHYPLIVLMHAAWLASLWIWGWNRSLSLPWLAVFALLQAGRLWVLATLGRRWTTRVLVVRGEAAVRRGPFRFVRHPNYLVVVLEMPVAPLALHLPILALVFGTLNAAMLAWRIRVEANAWRQTEATAP